MIIKKSLQELVTVSVEEQPVKSYNTKKEEDTIKNINIIQTTDSNAQLNCLLERTRRFQVVCARSSPFRYPLWSHFFAGQFRSSFGAVSVQFWCSHPLRHAAVGSHLSCCSIVPPIGVLLLFR